MCVMDKKGNLIALSRYLSLITKGPMAKKLDDRDEVRKLFKI